ncbi:MAG TPA: hypothetical protein DDW65_00670, partial [Firmicutes bacterium]|nr:hypothetical protein [Bacillota bacterium]
MNLSSREIVFLTSKSRPVFSIAKTNLFLLANLLMVVCCGVIFQHQAIFGSIVLESLIFLTTLAWTSLQGSSIGEILSLRLPSIPSLKAVGVTLIVVAAGIYVASFLDQLSRFCLQNRVPFPEVEISTPQSIPQYLWVLFALAAMPAIAEEALFRGFILKSYRTYLSTGKAVFISSLFFSMAHLSINNFWTP